MIVIRIIGLAAGGTSPADGKYVKEYEPDRRPDSPPGILCHLVLTDDARDALKLQNFGEFHALWTATSKKQPIRPDGKPNRPLTAFTITVEDGD